MKIQATYLSGSEGTTVVNRAGVDCSLDSAYLLPPPLRGSCGGLTQSQIHTDGYSRQQLVFGSLRHYTCAVVASVLVACPCHLSLSRIVFRSSPHGEIFVSKSVHALLNGMHCVRSQRSAISSPVTATVGSRIASVLALYALSHSSSADDSRVASTRFVEIGHIV